MMASYAALFVAGGASVFVVERLIAVCRATPAAAVAAPAAPPAEEVTAQMPSNGRPADGRTLPRADSDKAPANGGGKMEVSDMRCLWSRRGVLQCVRAGNACLSPAPDVTP